jgi:signal transduction histidine kinase
MAVFLFLGLTSPAASGAKYTWLVGIFSGATMAGICIAALGVVRDTSALKKKDREIVEKDAELQRFAYSVSHDLKSPLVTIKTFLDCLERDLTPAGSRERVSQDLQYIRSSYNRMNTLLDELFQLSRLGQRVRAASLFSYEEMVREAISILAGRIAAKKVRIDVAPDHLLLNGDRSQLLALWQNLIENAIKYTGEQREPRVSIGVQRRNAPVFYVADNGMGIDRDDQKRVFELFTKLDHKSEGNGFGLTLVKRIVEVNGGKIWVESRGRGYGSTFKFTLPGALVK